MSEMQLFSTMTFPEIYERVLVGPLFRPFAQEIIARLEATRSDSLIDIACGTGVVARLARETFGPEPQIVGVDVAPAMLAVARNVGPTIDWREGAAATLPVDDRERFSLLTCHPGTSVPSRQAGRRRRNAASACAGWPWRDRYVALAPGDSSRSRIERCSRAARWNDRRFRGTASATPTSSRLCWSTAAFARSALRRFHMT